MHKQNIEKPYAIIKTGGKQYRVKTGDEIDVELLHIDVGLPVEFNTVLFVNDGSQLSMGQPCVENCLVKGEVVGLSAAPKIVSLKYKPRQHTQKKWGHRQKYTRVKITEIGTVAKAKPKAAAETAKKVAKTDEKVAKKPAAKTAATKKPKEAKKAEDS